MKKLVIETAKKREIVDITELVEKIIVENSGISEGVCHLTTLHTMAALSICNLDPGTDLDILFFLWRKISSWQVAECSLFRV